MSLVGAEPPQKVDANQSLERLVSRETGFARALDRQDLDYILEAP